MVQADLGDEGLAGVEEAPEVRLRRDAIRPIGVGAGMAGNACLAAAVPGWPPLKLNTRAWRYVANK